MKPGPKQSGQSLLYKDAALLIKSSWDGFWDFIGEGRVYRQLYIQNFPGRKVNILGGHTIGHSMQKNYMYMCPIAYDFRDNFVSLYSFKIVDKK
jgi:hypothetical protein